MELKKPLKLSNLQTIRAVILFSFLFFLCFSAATAADQKPTQTATYTESGSVSGVTAGVTRAVTPNLAEISASIADSKITVTGTPFIDLAIVEKLAIEEAEEAEMPDELSEEVLRENEDVLLLARLIEGEAGIIDSIDERAAVGMTVLWRTDSPKWPNSIYENVYKPYQYEAAPEADAYYSEESMRAAIKAYTYWKTERGDEILPSEYMSFFGYGGHNWFYDTNLGIYNIPGVSTPENIYDAMTQTIPALRRATDSPDSAGSDEVAAIEAETSLEIVDTATPSEEVAAEVAENNLTSVSDESAMPSSETEKDTSAGPTEPDSVAL